MLWGSDWTIRNSFVGHTGDCAWGAEATATQSSSPILKHCDLLKNIVLPPPLHKHRVCSSGQALQPVPAIERPRGANANRKYRLRFLGSPRRRNALSTQTRACRQPQRQVTDVSESGMVRGTLPRPARVVVVRMAFPSQTKKIELSEGIISVLTHAACFS